MKFTRRLRSSFVVSDVITARYFASFSFVSANYHTHKTFSKTRVTLLLCPLPSFEVELCASHRLFKDRCSKPCAVLRSWTQMILFSRRGSLTLLYVIATRFRPDFDVYVAALPEEFITQQHSMKRIEILNWFCSLIAKTVEGRFLRRSAFANSKFSTHTQPISTTETTTSSTTLTGLVTTAQLTC